MFKDEDDTIVRWENEGGYVTLPDHLTMQMYAIVRAVAQGRGHLDHVQDIAVAIDKEVDRLLAEVLQSEHDDDA